ncbi:uncharacterized protein BKA78DRAFT_299428 [Phyllosticta capitalensis]|uniref:Uncharacterized protein n=1 Tax=Phyllosticta capitalensis TaxID=121624 RepID=A0ABR1YEG8_9PEZI
MENEGDNGNQVPSSPGSVQSRLRTVTTASGKTTTTFSHYSNHSDGTSKTFNLTQERLLTKNTSQPHFHPPLAVTGRSRRGSKASRKSIDKFSIKHKVSVRLRPRSAVSSGPSRKVSGSSESLIPPRSTFPHQHLKPSPFSRPTNPVNPASPLQNELPSLSPFQESISTPKQPHPNTIALEAEHLPQHHQESPSIPLTPRSSSNPESSSSSSTSSEPSAFSTPPRRPKSADNAFVPFTAPPGPRLIPRTQSSPSRTIDSPTISADVDEAWRSLRRKEFTLRIQEEVLKAGRRRLQQDREELERERRGFKEERQRWWRERVGFQGRFRVGEKSREAENAGDTDRTSWSETDSSEDGGGLSEATGAKSSGEDEEVSATRPESSRSRSESNTTYSSTASTTSGSGSSWSRRSTATNGNRNDKGTSRPSLPPTSSSAPNYAASAFASKSAQLPSRNQRHTYATYTQAWTSLPPSSAAIPFPTPTLLSDDLLSSPFLPSTPAVASLWPPETLIKQNAASFVLAGHTITSVFSSLTNPTPSSPPPQTYIPASTLRALGSKQLGALVSALRRELRRWHEDSLARRVGTDHGERENDSTSAKLGGRNKEKNRNDTLVADERVRAVFRAFTELRDEVLAEVRAREEDEVRKKGRDKVKVNSGERTAGRGPSRESEWHDWMGGGVGGIRSEDFI